MPYVAAEAIEAARQIDLLSYLRTQEPGELVHISGGTVSFEHGLWLGEGDIVITGGTVIVPGGEAGLTAENGKVTISGGAVREP